MRTSPWLMSSSREPGSGYSPGSVGGLTSEFPSLRLKVEVISGQNIPRPNSQETGEVIDPYVEVMIWGHGHDTSSPCKTEHVRNNGLNPCWGKRMEFALAFPHLAIIEFRVRRYRQSYFSCELFSIVLCYCKG